MAHKAGLSTEIVVSTAIEIADRDGIETLTLWKVAKELGVKTPSLYVHIDGMDDLMSKMRLVGRELMCSHFQHSVIGVSGDIAVRRIADSFRIFVKSHPSIYELTVKKGINDSIEIVNASKEVLETIYLILRYYPIPEEKLVHAVRYLRSTIHGFVSLEKSFGFGLGESIDDSFELLKDMIISNLKSMQSN